MPVMLHTDRPPTRRPRPTPALLLSAVQTGPADPTKSPQADALLSDLHETDA